MLLCFFSYSYAHNTSDSRGVGFYTSSNSLRHQLDVLQFDSILTPFTWTETPRLQGSVPGDWLPLCNANYKSRLLFVLLAN